MRFSITEDLGSVGLTTQIDVKHFHFSDSTFIRTKVIGQDGATRTTEVTSQGRGTLSILPPKVYFCVDLCILSSNTKVNETI